MTLMFADLLRGQWRLRRHVRSLTFFVQRPRKALASRGRSFLNPGPWRAETLRPRSDPEDSSDPLHPFPLCLWGWPSQGGIYDHGVVGYSDATDRPDRSGLA